MEPPRAPPSCLQDFNLLERRYDRYTAILPPGRVREELLAKVARQLAEIRVYFDTFNEMLAYRCCRSDYEDKAYYAGVRCMLPLKPVVSFLLDAEDSADDLCPLASSSGTPDRERRGRRCGGRRRHGWRNRLWLAFPRSYPRRQAQARRHVRRRCGWRLPPPRRRNLIWPPLLPAPARAVGQATHNLTGCLLPPTGAAFAPPDPGHPTWPAVVGGPWSGFAGPFSGSPGSS